MTLGKPEILTDIDNLQSTVSTHSTQLEEKAKQVDLVTETTERLAEIAVERARIDGFTALASGSTTGDAELIDIRTGADGITYANAGGAVRGQFNGVNNKVNNYVVERTENLFLPSMVTDNYYISYTTGNVASNSNYCGTIEYIDFEPNTWYNLYSTEGTINPQVAWYNGTTYIAGASSRSFLTGSTATKGRISFEKAYKNSVVLSKGIFSQKEKFVPYYRLKLDKNTIYTLADFSSATLGGYGETRTGNYSTKYTTTFTTRSTVLFTRNSANLKTGDFIFGRCKLKADRDVDQCNIQVVGSDGVYYNNIFRGLKANKEYTLFYRSGNFTSESATTMYLRINILRDDGSVTTTATISEICMTINNYNCYYDEDTKNTLPNFNTTIYTVGLNGINHFPDVSSACEFAKRAYNVLTTPVTIYVKNGIYDVYIGNNEPYAIFKGANRISIIGESESGVILQKTCTNLKQGRIIEAGGKCSIENMTLIQNIDGSFVSEYTDSRAYCIHLDSDFVSTVEYETVVKNVTCINYVNAPIGAGLRNNQKLVYKNCNLIYKANTGLNGAFYTHAPSDPTATNCSLVVDSCNIQHLANTGRAILIDDVSGSLSYTNIPCTFVRNAVYSQSGIVTEVDFKTKHLITPISSLNNVGVFNA